MQKVLPAAPFSLGQCAALAAAYVIANGSNSSHTTQTPPASHSPPHAGWFYNPFDLSVKGIANTGVVRWGGKTLALYEVSGHLCCLFGWLVCGGAAWHGRPSLPSACTWGVAFRVKCGIGTHRA